jgi:hypothetical protein
MGEVLVGKAGAEAMEKGAKQQPGCLYYERRMRHINGRGS